MYNHQKTSIWERSHTWSRNWLKVCKTGTSVQVIVNQNLLRRAVWNVTFLVSLHVWWCNS